MASPTNQAVFIELLLRCESALRGYLASVLGGSPDREDQFQEVCVVLWKKFPDYDSSRPFIPWALGIAARCLRKSLSKKARRSALLGPEELTRLAEEFAKTATPAWQHAREAALRLCLESLPPANRALIQSRYFEEETIDAISRRHRASPAAIYQTLSRIRRKLGECIQQRLNSYPNESA